MNDNGQIQIDPQAVIERLLHQVTQLTYQLALKDAYLQQLESEATSADTTPSHS